MCDVCVAWTVLEKKREGLLVSWPSRSEKVYVRATGKRAEFAPATYQMRRPRGRWSKPQKTKDLAGVMSRYGLDVKWPHVPLEVRRWLQGKARRPAGIADRLH